MDNGKVLLVEDNEKLNETNSRALAKKGYDVLIARTISEARELMAKDLIEVILLDVMLPDGDGMTFCGEIRDKTDAHILFLTAETGYEQRVRGLETGGDDYITKPYSLMELVSRVDAVMRRRKMSMAVRKTLSRGNLTLNIITGVAVSDGKDLLLSKKEFALLFLLVQNEGKILTAEHLYNEIWQSPMIGNNRALQTRVSELRKKMVYTGCAYTINSVYGKGYCLEKI